LTPNFLNVSRELNVFQKSLEQSRPESLIFFLNIYIHFLFLLEQQFDGVKLIIRGDLLIALACLLLMSILILLFLCCWYCKSRQRRKDNFHRQNSLRRSVKQEMNKQSTLSLHKINDNTLIKSSTLSTLTNGTTNKLPLSSLSLSSHPLSSVTMNSDNDLSTSSLAHHDFSLLKLIHNIYTSVK
jgi:hypothetical protein